MEKVSWGIIGCGNVTEVKSGPAFNKVPGSTLHAVMRRNVALAKDYAERHGVPKWYAAANDLINDPAVNAIYIATPPASHEEYALAAIAAGKNVYVEKPMSTNTPMARNIADAAAAAGVKLSVAHYRRRLPLFRKIKAILDSREMGDIRFAELRLCQSVSEANGTANWRVQPEISGGGYFHDLAPHQLDLMLHFFGGPVKANGIALNQAGEYPADDMVTGTILFENNIVVNGLWCFAVPDTEACDNCTIMGSQGSLKFSIFNMTTLEINRNGKEEKMIFEPETHVQQPMIAEVVKFFLGEADNPCPGSDGVAVMKMIDDLTA